MYNILVVDDSALMRRVICDIISADSDFRVLDVSSDGEDAYKKIKNNSYDVVVLDMILPKMSALQVLEKLDAEKIPFKVVLISSSLKEDADSTVKAMELGALDFVVKPLRSTPENREEFSKKLLSAIKNTAKVRASNARLSRREAFLQASAKEAGSIAPIAKRTARPTTDTMAIKGKKIIALACSTGGPQALHEFIPMLPATLRYPLVLVQHMPAGFTASLANRLDAVAAIKVKEAEEGEFFEPGCVYITPGGKHMEIRENASRDAFCHLSSDPPVNSLRPCADLMYKSLANSSFEEIICVVLTGMGADGTEGISYLNKYKKTYVISQEASTCVVYGMPKSVEQSGLSDEVVPLKSVANSIVKKIGG